MIILLNSLQYFISSVVQYRFLLQCSMIRKRIVKKKNHDNLLMCFVIVTGASWGAVHRVVQTPAPQGHPDLQESRSGHSGQGLGGCPHRQW